MSYYEPLVSVYVVNHNYGRFVTQAVDSVLSQTLQDFELLIIDNGSTDNSHALIKPFINHPKILTVFQDNLGLSTANNVALGRAKGRYIMRLDADDFLDPHALEVLSNALTRNSEIGLVFPDYYIADEMGQILEIVRRQDISKDNLLDLPAHGACSMMRRDCLLALEGYDETYSCQDGWDLWLRFIEHYGALRPLADKPLIDWTLEAAITAKRVSRVVVTSPDDKILDHVTQTFGDQVSTVRRDWQLAVMSSPLDLSLTDLFEHIPDDWRTFDALAVLYIDSPFRSARYIDMAIDVLDVFDLNRVMGMHKGSESFYRHGHDGMAPVRFSEDVRDEHQELYRRSGGLFVVRRGHWFRDMDEDKRIGHVELDEAAALKVETKWTWRIAENHARYIADENQPNEQSEP
jgi:CMP-N-acetylneuraminic acid synthetase